MTRAANSNSLRSEMLRLFREDPRAVLPRQDLAKAFGVTVKCVDRVAQQMKTEGVIAYVSGYRLVEGVKLPTIKPRRAPVKTRMPGPPKPYAKPPVPCSVWDFATQVAQAEAA